MSSLPRSVKHKDLKLKKLVIPTAYGDDQQNPVVSPRSINSSRSNNSKPKMPKKSSKKNVYLQQKSKFATEGNRNLRYANSALPLLNPKKSRKLKKLNAYNSVERTKSSLPFKSR